MAIVALWATRIMDNKNSFGDVPAGLKEKVKAFLTEAGREDLITE